MQLTFCKLSCSCCLYGRKSCVSSTVKLLEMKRLWRKAKTYGKQTKTTFRHSPLSVTSTPYLVKVGTIKSGWLPSTLLGAVRVAQAGTHMRTLVLGWILQLSLVSERNKQIQVFLDYIQSHSGVRYCREWPHLFSKLIQHLSATNITSQTENVQGQMQCQKWKLDTWPHVINLRHTIENANTLKILH